MQEPARPRPRMRSSKIQLSDDGRDEQCQENGADSEDGELESKRGTTEDQASCSDSHGLVEGEADDGEHHCQPRACAGAEARESIEVHTGCGFNLARGC